MGNDTITLLSPREIEKMRRAGRLAAKLLDHLAEMVRQNVGLAPMEPKVRP
jgi:methionyl aminopeptidase